METVKLSNGVEMPVLGYGVYQVDPGECERCVTDALEAGYRMVDTAQAYANEEGVGNAVKKSGIPRDRLFLVTKIWITNAGQEKAAASIDDWYMQYSDDGCCDEGAQYWHAAPLCFFGCIKILSEATGGALSSLSSDMKLRAMASYITNVHVAGDRYLNFADCSPCAGWLGAREYLFGSFAGCSELVDLAVSDFREQYSKAVAEGRAVRLYDNDYNLWYNYLEYSLADEMLECRLPSPKPLPSFTRYDSVGLYIYRRDGVVLAVKGGGNDDSHNHNDTGSLILYDGSHPILADIGVETYTKTTFSKDRYTLFPMQSLYHNVVNFAGVGQEAGAQFRAKDVEADERGVSMELG